VRLDKTNYTCLIHDGRHKYTIDEPLDKGGSDKGPDPYSMLLASLGSCTAITLKMYAERKGWNVEDINITMSIVPTSDNSKRTTVFVRDIDVKGQLSSEQLDRLQQIAKLCPVSKILEGSIEITTVLKKTTS